MVGMAMAQAATADFVQASISMRDLLEQLQVDIASLSASSVEAFQRFKQDLPRSWGRWQAQIGDYKISLQNLPKDLRQRFFIKRTFKDIDLFEQEIRQFLSKVRETPLVDGYVKDLQARIGQITRQVAELEEHSLVQKFLKGEKVLAGRESIQWGRKGVHVFLGLFFLYLFVYSGLSQVAIWSVTTPFLLFAFSLEIARHLNPKVNRWAWHTFGFIMRESEKTKVNSAILYIISMLFAYLLFPIEVAMLTLLFIAVADPIAGVVGVYLGKRRISDGVSLEGSLACFVSCTLLAMLCAGVLFENSLSIFPLVVFSISAGAMGTVAEASFKRLDDNLVMPVLSAPGLWLLMKIFH